MESLTFSEFANMLYPYCGNGENKADFVITLTNKIMGGRPGAARGTDQYKNPMKSKNIRTLQTYFKGTRSISQRDASTILGSCDTYKFEEYLRYQCSEKALSLLKEDLDRRLGEGSSGDVVEICSDLFVAILHKLASGKVIR